MKLRAKEVVVFRYWLCLRRQGGVPMKLGNCLFRVVMTLVVLWIVACLVANVVMNGKLLPGA